MKTETIIEHWKRNGSKHIEREKDFRELLDALHQSESSVTDEMIEKEAQYNSCATTTMTRLYREGIVYGAKWMRSLMSEKTKELEAQVNELQDKLNIAIKTNWE